MTMPMIAPVRDQSELKRVSRCLLHFRASDLSNQAVGGQDAAFARGAVASIADPAGSSFTCGFTQPTWETLPWQGGAYAAFLRMGSLDRFHFACNWRPQALGFYHEFRQSTGMGSGLTLWTVANDAVTGARLRLYSNGTAYVIEHHNGTTSQVAGLAVGPTTNDSVVLWGYLYADGSVQLWQSVNGNIPTNTSASGANALAGAWGATPRVRLSANGTIAGAPSYHKVFKLVPGLPSLAQLQRAF